MEKERRIDGNTATSLLKLVALVFMFCDHAGKMLLPNVPEMRIIGRIAFPLYAWCMVVGFHYTRSVPKYLLRVLVIGLVSQPLYMIALNHTWTEPNIFLTLLLALCALWGIREKKLWSQVWAPALALGLAVVLHVDYGWKGVLLVLLLYAAQTSRAAIAATMVAFCLYWGSNSSTVTGLFGYTFQCLKYPPFSTLLPPFLKLQGLALLALPLMLPRMNVKLNIPSWVGYALYPEHLLVLIVLEQLL